MKLNECFYLNWEFCQLSGFENNKSLQCIEAIIRGINLNDKFPPVHVFQISPFSFSISGFHYVKTLQNETKIDAGHHRAIAHFIENKPLYCKLVNPRSSIGGLPGQIEHKGIILIPNIQIIDSVIEYERKKKMFSNYR